MTKNKVWIQSREIVCHGNIPLEMEKNNSRSFIHGQSCTIPANFVKIDLVDVEIIRLKNIFKNTNET